jgi:hypothetical protein
MKIAILAALMLTGCSTSNIDKAQEVYEILKPKPAPVVVAPEPVVVPVADPNPHHREYVDAAKAGEYWKLPNSPAKGSLVTGPSISWRRDGSHGDRFEYMVKGSPMQLYKPSSGFIVWRSGSRWDNVSAAAVYKDEALSHIVKPLKGGGGKGPLCTAGTDYSGTALYSNGLKFRTVFNPDSGMWIAVRFTDGTVEKTQIVDGDRVQRGH